MKKITHFLVVFGVLVAAFSCKRATPAEYLPAASDPELYHRSIEKLTEVIIHDIFTPPVASRIYTYANLAAYEAMVPGFDNYKTLGGKLNKLGQTPKPEAGAEYCFPLASTRAFLNVGRTLTFSANFWDNYEKTFYDQYKKVGVPADVMKRSMAYGDSVAKFVLNYASKDSYKQTRGFRHTITNEPGTWVPTPPAYADAVEPNWFKIRPVTMDSAAQFMPPPPPPYNLDKRSKFMQELTEVYDTGNNLTDEQRQAAYFWDDNAFVMNVQGHVMFANKKMTPGGHWLAINATVCRDKKTTFAPVVEAYTLTSFALFDAFISCWDEKYRSVKVRPETVINAEIDPKWQPFLQTPPFPEYTSGHSTISGAASEVMSKLFGDNVTFTDSTEHKFGHGVLTFKSFREAAAMASASRVYGGIHYRSGCEVGLVQGKKIGLNVLARAKTR